MKVESSKILFKFISVLIIGVIITSSADAGFWKKAKKTINNLPKNAKKFVKDEFGNKVPALSEYTQKQISDLANLTKDTSKVTAIQLAELGNGVANGSMRQVADFNDLGNAIAVGFEYLNNHTIEIVTDVGAYTLDFGDGVVNVAVQAGKFTAHVEQLGLNTINDLKNFQGNFKDLVKRVKGLIKHASDEAVKVMASKTKKWLKVASDRELTLGYFNSIDEKARRKMLRSLSESFHKHLKTNQQSIFSMAPGYSVSAKSVAQFSETFLVNPDKSIALDLVEELKMQKYRKALASNVFAPPAVDFSPSFIFYVSSQLSGEEQAPWKIELELHVSTNKGLFLAANRNSEEWLADNVELVIKVSGKTQAGLALSFKAGVGLDNAHLILNNDSFGIKTPNDNLYFLAEVWTSFKGSIPLGKGKFAGSKIEFEAWPARLSFTQHMLGKGWGWNKKNVGNLTMDVSVGTQITYVQSHTKTRFTARWNYINALVIKKGFQGDADDEVFVGTSNPHHSYDPRQHTALNLVAIYSLDNSRYLNVDGDGWVRCEAYADSLECLPERSKFWMYVDGDKIWLESYATGHRLAYYGTPDAKDYNGKMNKVWAGRKNPGDDRSVPYKEHTFKLLDNIDNTYSLRVTTQQATNVGSDLKFLNVHQGEGGKDDDYYLYYGMHEEMETVDSSKFFIYEVEETPTQGTFGLNSFKDPDMHFPEVIPVAIRSRESSLFLSLGDSGNKPSDRRLRGIEYYGDLGDLEQKHPEAIFWLYEHVHKDLIQLQSITMGDYVGPNGNSSMKDRDLVASYSRSANPANQLRFERSGSGGFNFSDDPGARVKDRFNMYIDSDTEVKFGKFSGVENKDRHFEVIQLPELAESIKTAVVISNAKDGRFWSVSTDRDNYGVVNSVALSSPNKAIAKHKFNLFRSGDVVWFESQLTDDYVESSQRLVADANHKSDAYFIVTEFPDGSFELRNQKGHLVTVNSQRHLFCSSSNPDIVSCVCARFRLHYLKNVEDTLLIDWDPSYDSDTDSGDDDTPPADPGDDDNPPLGDPDPYAGFKFPIRINYQPKSSQVPASFYPDCGMVYTEQNGHRYGWNSNNKNQTRQRNTSHKQQQNNTLILIDGKVWEIELPNGDYNIHLVCGDPVATNQINSVNIEGVNVKDPDGFGKWDKYNVDVTVNDNRLTIKEGPNAKNAKMAHLKISRNSGSGGSTDWQELVFANFDSGFRYFIDGGEDCRIVDKNSVEHGAVELRDGTSSSHIRLKDSLRLYKYSEFKIDFSFISENLMNDHNLELYYSTDDGKPNTWLQIAEFQKGKDFDNGKRHNKSVIIKKADYLFDNRSRIKFQLDSKEDGNKIYLDNISLSAK
ncbi:MAG: hypothetical protein AAGA18_14695 [Verrucomicrobiota bacterium]